MGAPNKHPIIRRSLLVRDLLGLEMNELPSFSEEAFDRLIGAHIFYLYEIVEKPADEIREIVGDQHLAEIINFFASYGLTLGSPEDDDVRFARNECGG